MPDQRNPELLDSLRRHKKGSILQLIRDLEEFSTVIKMDIELLWHRLASLRPMWEQGGSQHGIEYGEGDYLESSAHACGNFVSDCDEISARDTFASSSITTCEESSAISIARECPSEVDLVFAKNKAGEIVILAPKSASTANQATPKLSCPTIHRKEGNSLRLNCYNSYDEDLARKIEAMATEAEAAFANRKSMMKYSFRTNGTDLFHLEPIRARIYYE